MLVISFYINLNNCKKCQWVCAYVFICAHVCMNLSSLLGVCIIPSHKRRLPPLAGVLSLQEHQLQAVIFFFRDCALVLSLSFPQLGPLLPIWAQQCFPLPSLPCFWPRLRRDMGTHWRLCALHACRGNCCCGHTLSWCSWLSFASCFIKFFLISSVPPSLRSRDWNMSVSACHLATSTCEMVF